MEENQGYEDDEITLKELILKIKEYIHEVWVNKMITIIFILLLFSFFMYKALVTPTTYSANLK